MEGKLDPELLPDEFTGSPGLSAGQGPALIPVYDIEHFPTIFNHINDIEHFPTIFNHVNDIEHFPTIYNHAQPDPADQLQISEQHCGSLLPAPEPGSSP